MPKARYRQVSVENTPYYHCISRCVRRAYLCGTDPVSGYNFEHRRQWIIDRIKLLCSVFSVDLCAYAIMNNHYHIVVKINSELVADWSDEEVAQRWMKIFRGPSLMHQFIDNVDLTRTEHQWIEEIFTTWRERLCDLSWFMRCINEPIARQANREDHCSGRFWEGRFTSQPLLDERALLACMAYVDLNPIRAAKASLPEQSDYTSIQERINQPHNDCLMAFDDQADNCIPCNLNDYLELVDWGGREIKRNKRGYIPAHAPPILTRLKMDASPVLDYLTKDDLSGFAALGPVSMLRDFASSIGQKFVKGHAFANRLCPERA